MTPVPSSASRAASRAPSPATGAQPGSLVSVRPTVSPERLLADLVPPRHFDDARFATYRANPEHPSQGVTPARLEEVAAEIAAPPPSGLRALLGRRRPAPAVYMDGGFGVGKTHLLTSLAHAVTEAAGEGSAAYGTFVEYTNLVGALGFLPTVDALATRRLVCIDEFELDDPGDTVLMSRLLRELADRGVALAATSNTLPDALGEGRFAAEDFLREIQALAGRFEVLRVDGEDYRHRAVVTDAEPLPDAAVRAAVRAQPGAVLDDFEDLLAHLATVHPSRYGALLDGVELVALTGVRPVTRQEVALRLVVLVDRLYDRDVPVLLAGVDGAAQRTLFTPEMLQGGYRKKYFRALSRLGALAQEGRSLTDS
ncbi:cell division protein ZapE [Isoptericola sp. CG 20/1183]|uniref:Cell division protein ZapE n=1 Tax=Isoptericola halotolerans TaxID=300560 RepID=A0ABX5EB51_9MICO|nr:cell division protein ZapE [Isoptericola sp. CG 20/1183]PRZ04070.1 cell division protein ZapE [Isoptericola halotolerans]